jgi:hypothetical protein
MPGHPTARLSPRSAAEPHGWHWLDYDPVAIAVLLIGIGIVLLVALSI